MRGRGINRLLQSGRAPLPVRRLRKPTRRRGMIPAKEPTAEPSAPSNVQLAFTIRQKVRVIELERPGVVISIHITNDGPKYEVRYFWDGTAKEVYFYDWEIQPRNE